MNYSLESSVMLSPEEKVVEYGFEVNGNIPQFHMFNFLKFGVILAHYIMHFKLAIRTGELPSESTKESYFVMEVVQKYNQNSDFLTIQPHSV